MKHLPCSIAVILALSPISAGCAPRSVELASNQPSFEKMRAETEQAFEQERLADVVIHFERPDETRIWTPHQSTNISTIEPALAAAIPTMTSERGLAVVVIGKSVRQAYPEIQLENKLDEIRAVLMAHGFERIVFQLSSASGRCIHSLSPECKSH